MTDIEYQEQAERALRAVEQCCDRISEESDADIDNLRSGGMVTLTFANRSQIIINLHKPLHEIWLAARAGGFHFKFVNGNWVDTKDGRELFALLSQYASEQGGQPLQFSLPAR